MNNPYQIESPALISFSGGRTSGYMLRQIIDAFDGRLLHYVIPCFANTGKEMPKTLNFVRECGRRWGVNIVWLEYNPALPDKFEIVDYLTASRSGEPFERLLTNRGMPRTRLLGSVLPNCYAVDHLRTKNPDEKTIRPLAGLGALDERIGSSRR